VLLWVVWIVVVVLSVVVLGALAYGVLGARARLAREVTAFEREVRPLLDQVAATAERAARTDDGSDGSR
jgi:hypothetical protein